MNRYFAAMFFGWNKDRREFYCGLDILGRLLYCLDTVAIEPACIYLYLKMAVAKREYLE